MNPLSFLMQPASSVLANTGISSKKAESDKNQSGPFVLTMEKAAISSPANFAATAGSATASTLFQAQEIGQAEPVRETPKSAADKFLDYMNKTPEELMREQILKELGYSEEQLAGMDPQDRAKAEEQIRMRLQEKIEQSMREKGIDASSGKTALADSLDYAL